ncbi:MAG: sugar phosphate isomerase/epimerase [Clostridia bacterium]|nr:sugar phosphate isomerase/epimerase [Clostridia bacterium]
MNRIGISSSCYYPDPTETAFAKVCAAHVPVAEIFFNSVSELAPSFVRGLRAEADDAGVRVVSVHPYGSFAEGYWLFSSYERRFADGLEEQKRFFEAMNLLGATIYVLHGAKNDRNFYTISDALYYERFARLAECARSFGVTAAQENIVHYRSQDIAFLQGMRDFVGGDFRTVLDIKQARRAGVDVYEYLRRLGGSVCHVHLSDFTDTKDCAPPGEGKFDFLRLFSALRESGYAGDYIIELYRHSYEDESQILGAYDFLTRELVGS